MWEIILPVYNEERRLKQGVIKLYNFLKQKAPFPWQIVIVDNGSTDNTLSLAQELCSRLPNLRLLHLDLKGRGRALKQAWLSSQAEFLGYMDIDLSTELGAIFKVAEAFSQGFPIVIGSRHLPQSEVKRSLKRTILSRGYNLLLRVLFRAKFTDAQCGFKFLTREAVQELVPQVKDTDWFFDTELLILAQRKGYRIAEVPVSWQEDPDSRVKVWKTVWRDIKGVVRMLLS